MDWPLQDAKHWFSEVVQRARLRRAANGHLAGRASRGGLVRGGL